MIIDPKQVVKNNLREGETVGSVRKSLDDLAEAHMRRDFNGLLHNLHQPPNLSWRELFSRMIADKRLNRAYCDQQYMHVFGYFGEIAVLDALSRDWHHVYEANDISEYTLADGKVNGFEYDVKTKSKDEDGLSMAESKIRYDFYILCIWRGGYVHTAGYASKLQLLNGRSFSYFDGTPARALRRDDPLHSFEEFLQRFKH